MNCPLLLLVLEECNKDIVTAQRTRMQFQSAPDHTKGNFFIKKHTRTALQHIKRKKDLKQECPKYKEISIIKKGKENQQSRAHPPLMNSMTTT